MDRIIAQWVVISSIHVDDVTPVTTNEGISAGSTVESVITIGTLNSVIAMLAIKFISRVITNNYIVTATTCEVLNIA